eukprot:CAMPEP_0182431324 /NCGR_PEP_ID=MMETSP1167-20130531/48229_1 /TAXON_ID=2988 /ORGANISM="Mallomonas Sp, Strain CCMP3275" /LENGTH=344 /DNA_ID=CAMNT_0024617535 /DNA_START=90 /DNA_END=1121 /DNA_ORIENTATION=-
MKKEHGEVVFIIRTYHGHFTTESVFNLPKMLASLQSLTFSKWEAFIINTDTKPLPRLPVQDHRIFSINIYPVRYNEWIAGYDVTDAALERLRQSNFKWVIVTNGDNLYEKDFLDQLEDTKDIDLIVTDYWSRNERDDSVKTIEMSSKVCHKGKLQPGYVDLGGVIFSLSRYYADNLYFMKFGAINSQDGLMFRTMLSLGWRVRHVPICLFSHAPNPYSCSQLGGTWYESSASRNELSSACWSEDAVRKQLKMNPLLRRYHSSSGISLIALPPDQHEIRLKERGKDQAAFANAYILKLRERRQPYCKALKKMGYRLDWQQYSILNPDLQQSTSRADKKFLVSHFW